MSASLSDKFAFTIPEFTHISGFGRTFTYGEIKAGRLKVRKAGRRTIILRDDALSYLNSLPELAPAGADLAVPSHEEARDDE